MAISSVKATVNGTSYTLTYNSTTGAYEGTVTAPSKSSFTQSGGYYGVTITAYDDAGNSTTADASDASFGDALKLFVTEKVAPTITVVSPSNDALLGSNKPTISWKCADSDSGVDKDSIKLYIDNVEVSGTITASLSGNTYTCSYVPVSALSDGEHTIKFACADNDGNSSTKSITLTIDTVPPTLNVAAPAEGLKTNMTTITVSGTTNDITSSPVSLTVNGTSVTVNSNGAFSTTVDLVFGENTITIVATDGVGKSTTISRKVYFNDIAPTIEEVSMVPNPVDAGKTFVISVKVTDE